MTIAFQSLYSPKKMLKNLELKLLTNQILFQYKLKLAQSPKKLLTAKICLFSN